MTDQLRADFRNEDFWTGETPRFLWYARALIARQQWRGTQADEPLDYVMRAVALILDGRRRCPPEVDSVQFVMGVIRSLVTHDAERPEHRRSHAPISPDEDSSITSIDEVLTAEDLARDFVDSLPEACRAYVELLISGACSTAAECAARLHMTVAQVRAMDRTIRRRRKSWKGAPRSQK